MFHAPTSALYRFVIVCEECHQNVPAPVETMPDSWIIAMCPLCGEQRRYLPIDIFQGRLSHDFLAKFRQMGGEQMGEMKRVIAREEQERRNQDRFASTIVIATAIIAAVRLARDDISSPSPRVYAAIADSVSLARKILQRVIG
jgi:hypothetical protein